MVYFFLGLAGFWAFLGILQVFDSRGDVGGLKAALPPLVMAFVNVAVAWFLHWRTQRRAPWRR